MESVDVEKVRRYNCNLRQTENRGKSETEHVIKERPWCREKNIPRARQTFFKKALNPVSTERIRLRLPKL